MEESRSSWAHSPTPLSPNLRLGSLPLESIELIIDSLDPTSSLALFTVNKGIHLALRDNVRFWRRLLIKLGLLSLEGVEERRSTITTASYKNIFQDWKTGWLELYLIFLPFLSGLIVESLYGQAMGVTPYISRACGEYFKLDPQSAFLVEDEGLEAFQIMNIEDTTLHILSHANRRNYTSCQGWQNI